MNNPEGDVSMETRLQYSKREDFFNAASHGLGVLLAISGSVIMIVYAARLQNLTSVVSVVIYGLSMIVMYLMSTLYHAARHNRSKQILQIFDHASIFLLIAGCYTPLTLILLGGTPRALILLAAVWVAAIIGVILNAVNLTRMGRVSMVLYLLMGWAALMEIRNIATLLGTAGTVLLIAGGLTYTVGVVFYKMKSIKYMHCIWHLFVLAGSVLHYLCILRYVILA